MNGHTSGRKKTTFFFIIRLDMRICVCMLVCAIACVCVVYIQSLIVSSSDQTNQPYCSTA